MQQKQHHIQDALELYAVALLQRLAQERGVALSRDAAGKLRAFHTYAAARGLTDSDFDSGEWAAYKATLDKFLPCFVDRLIQTLPGRRMDFIDVEAAYRDTNKKGDFVIVTDRGETISVSLKNYLGRGLRPQLSSGTYNSFVLGFLFEADGVGCYKDPQTGTRFKGSTVARRDSVLDANGYGKIKAVMQRMDELNRQIKQRFVYSPEFKYLDEGLFKEARQECGDAGATLALQALAPLDNDRIKARLLKMTGFDGKEEILLLYQDRFTDSITVPGFGKLRAAVQAPDTKVTFAKRGQSIRFDFVAGGEVILSVDVPFTINKNGAWISSPPFKGLQYHDGEKMNLAWGQRRPKKSKELATSTNTYVDFSKKPGIFIEAATCSST